MLIKILKFKYLFYIILFVLTFLFFSKFVFAVGGFQCSTGSPADKGWAYTPSATHKLVSFSSGKTCKLDAYDQGTFWLEIYKDNPFTEAIATSTIYYFGEANLFDVQNNMMVNCLTGFTWEFPDGPILEASELYIFVIRRSRDTVCYVYDDTNQTIFPAVTGISYTQGAAPSDTYYLWYSEYATWSYEDVEIIELPDWQGEVGVGYDQGLYVQTHTQCVVDSTCDLDYRYGYNLIGGTLYLFEQDVEIVPADAVASSTVEDLLFLRGSFELEAVASSTIDNYFFLWTNEDTVEASTEFFTWGWQGQSGENGNGYYVVWREASSFLNDIFSDYACDTICDDIATSSNDFFWGIECGFRKALCWSFVPSESSISKFTNSVHMINSVFPFSIYHQIETAVQSVNLATSTSVLKLNTFFPEDSFDGDVVILDSTTLQTGLGNIWTMVWNVMRYIIYFLAFGYFFWRIMGIARKEKTE